MEPVNAIPSAATLAHWEKKFPPLAQEQRSHIATDAAAHYLSRRPQTLRGWQCHGDYPIPEVRPVVINGRLHWPVAGLRSLLGVQ